MVTTIRPRRPRESAVEDTCRRHARALGFLLRKMNGVGFRAWPDRLLIGPAAAPGTLWVEFKRPPSSPRAKREGPTEAQAALHADLRARGEEVWVVDSVGDFKWRLAAWIADHRRDG